MNAKSWTAALLFGLLGLSAALLARWPTSESPLNCPPEQVRAFDAGFGPMVLRCAEGGAPVPAGAALTLGQKLNLNQATEDELLLLPGVGPKLAKALVEARAASGRLCTWDEVDRIPGVGPSVLSVLQAKAKLGCPGEQSLSEETSKR